MTISDPAVFKQQLLQWSVQYDEIIFLDSNEYLQHYTSFDWILAVDAFTSIQTDYHNAFEDLKQHQQTTKDWIFGYLSYDLKNDTEDLTSENSDGLNFADIAFFQPKKIYILKGDQLEMHYLNLCAEEIGTDLADIHQINLADQKASPALEINQRIERASYLEKVSKMLEHIHRGDIYEANFCMEFYSENAIIDPLSVFNQLNAISTPPFATFMRIGNQYALCASPERYLRKQGQKIISQPIKGTARRDDISRIDKKNQHELSNSEKERSENIMIVDLVRNDLSKTAVKGSVNVEELCGIYAFKQVHHLISTVVSEVDSNIAPVGIIKSTFPMGSMTGAPKISAMKIIDSLEETRRGLYSGAIGYFAPNGDFDFNVVIRSILYNYDRKYVSFHVGSAITAEAIAEAEYEECLLKADAMFKVLR